MKKVYLFLFSLVAIAIGAQAQLVTVNSGQTVTVTVGDTIQSLDDLKTAIAADANQLFVIQNYGDARDSHAAFYQESATATDGINAFTATADMRTLVKLTIDDSNNLTIQAYSGRYYATSGGSQQNVLTADTAATFTISSAANAGNSKLANGFRILSNNTYLNTHGNAPNKTPTWNTTSGTGNYSIVRIYKASATVTDLDGFQDLQTAITTASAYTVGTGLSQYTDADSTFTRALTAAKALTETAEDPAKNGEYEQAATALTAAISSLTLNMPTDSIYLLIKNKLNGGYLTAPATVNTATSASATSLQSDSAQVWQYHIKGTSGVQGFLKSHYGNYLETNWQTTANNNASGASGTTIEANPAIPGTYRIYVPRGGWYYGFVNDSTSGSVSSTKLSGNNIDFSNAAYAWTLQAISLATDTVIPTPDPEPQPVDTTKTDTTKAISNVFGKYVSVADSAVTSFSNAKWYMMAGYQSNNTANRYVYYTTTGNRVYNSTVGFRVTTTSPFSGDSIKADSTNMDYLFRIVSAGTDSTYYIQTATGKYFAELHNNEGSSQQTLNSDSVGHAYIIQAYQDGYTTVRCESNRVVLMNNSGNNNNVVGWATGNPTKTPNNDVWKFFEVTLTDSTVIPTPEPEPQPEPVVDSTAVKVATTATTSIDTTKWYLMAGYQSGNTANRYVYYTENGHRVYGSTVGFYVNTTSPFSGDSVKADSTNMDYLFRFIPAGTDSTFYIQTATGKFFAQLFDNDGKGGNSQTLKSDTTAHAYVIKNFNTDSPSYFAIRCAANSVLMHNNSAPNNNVVGWGTATPSAIPNNNVWQLFETTYQNDSLPTPKPEPTPTPTPEPAKEYTYVLNTYGQPANAVITLAGTDFVETDGVLKATKSNQMTTDSLQVSNVEGYTHTVSLADTVFTVTFLCQATAPDTLSSKYVVVAEQPATTLEAGKWYMLAGYQSGSSDNRYVYYTTSGNSVYGSTTGFRVSTTNPFENGQVQVSQDNINYLIRLIPAAKDNEYFIQTAGGQYFNQLANNETLGRTPATLQATANGYPYTIATFNEATYPTYFAIHCATNNVLMHNNGAPNNNVVGWGTATPSTVPNNNVWQLFEVSLSDEIVGINTATTGTTTSTGYNPNAPAYNLHGQRVGNGYKGVVIQGGKKYIVK